MGASRKRRHFHSWEEGCRIRAVTLKRHGWKNSEIAQAFGVSKSAVSKWLRTAEQRGRKSLMEHRHTGAPPKLTPEQRDLIPELLWHGAEAYGFQGQVWTCARIAKVIEWEFGVPYSPAHVSRIVKDLKWTPQKPTIRAIQRDETLIQNWRDKVWPDLKKSQKREKMPYFTG